MMKFVSFAFVAMLTLAPAWCQRYKPTINTETPEGAQLQAIGQESDPAKKSALMEKFIAEFPKHDAVAWVYSLMIPAYVASGDMAKASNAGDRLLALQPDDHEAALAVLKGYEKVKDPAAVIKWAGIASNLAKKLEAQPDTQEYAKQVQQYTEYALLNQTTQGGDALKSLDCVNALEKLNPKSQYLTQAQNSAFLALRQANQLDKAIELADRTLAKDSSNEDMLVVAADYYMRKQSNDKALQYATKLVEVVNSKPKPAQVSDDDWTKRKTTLGGIGNYIAGMIYAGQNKYPQANKSLRDALPTLTDESMKGGALYQLGFVNIKMAEASANQQQIQEALRYSQQSAAIKSPYQANAAKNAAAIRAKYKVSAAK